MKLKVLKNNKYSNFKFNTEEKFHAGVVLKGTDVRSIKNGLFNVKDCYIVFRGNELFLENLVIESPKSTKVSRKLLLKRSEINKIMSFLRNKRYHGYVLDVVYNDRNLIKFNIGIGTVKKKIDKKASQKRSTEKRNIELQIKKGLI